MKMGADGAVRRLQRAGTGADGDRWTRRRRTCSGRSRSGINADAGNLASCWGHSSMLQRSPRALRWVCSPTARMVSERPSFPHGPLHPVRKDRHDARHHSAHGGLVALVLGAVIGHGIGLDAGVKRAANRLGEGEGAALVQSTLLFCVGAMTLVGCMQDEPRGPDHPGRQRHHGFVQLPVPRCRPRPRRSMVPAPYWSRPASP